MAGNGRGGPKAGTAAKKKFRKKYGGSNLKKRGKDLDQVQDELVALAAGTRSADAYLDEDKAGCGAFFCVVCSRPFVSAAVQADHENTKPHKRMLRLAAEPSYGQADADAAAGGSSAYGRTGRLNC